MDKPSLLSSQELGERILQVASPKILGDNFSVLIEQQVGRYGTDAIQTGDVAIPEFQF